MRHALPLSWAVRVGAVVITLGVAGCATLQQVAALRRVAFAYDRISDVLLAGVRLDGKQAWTDVRVAEATRLANAVAGRQVPLDLTFHLRAENPPDNSVSARLTEMDWTLFVEDRRTVSGRLGGTYLLPPGEAVDVPLAVRFDLLELLDGRGRDLFDLALAIAGWGGAPKRLRIELMPTIETPLGPIRYPQPISVERVVG
jgi:hypothetical protein